MSEEESEDNERLVDIPPDAAYLILHADGSTTFAYPKCDEDGAVPEWPHMAIVRFGILFGDGMGPLRQQVFDLIDSVFEPMVAKMKSDGGEK